MAYNKHSWTNGEVITAALLNNIETQYDCVLTDYINQAVKTSSSPSFVGLTINGNISVTGNVDGVDVSSFKSAYDSHNHDSAYAPIGNGVTNGDAHDHSGGDGGQIAHDSLSGIGTNSHTTIDAHIVAASPHSGHVVANTAITAGTNCKITYDAKGLVTAGAALAAGDIPNLDTGKLTSGTLGTARGGTGLSSFTAGSVLYASSTSVISQAAPTAANQVLRSTAANAFSWGSLVAADIPSLDTSKLTSGTLGVARGGTGLSSIAAGGILYASAANTLSRIAPSAANQVLRSTAANAASWGSLVAADIPSLDTSKLTSGTLGTARGGTGLSSFYTGGIMVATSTSALGTVAPSGVKQVPRASDANSWAWSQLSKNDISGLGDTDSPVFKTLEATDSGLALIVSGRAFIGMKAAFQARGGGPSSGSNTSKSYSSEALVTSLTEQFDTNNVYGNTVTGTFVAPVNGYYLFTFSACILGYTTDYGMILAYLNVYTSSSSYLYSAGYTTASNSNASNEYCSANGSCFLYLAQGYRVKLAYKYKRGENNSTSAARWHFSGFLMGVPS